MFLCLCFALWVWEGGKSSGSGLALSLGRWSTCAYVLLYVSMYRNNYRCTKWEAKSCCIFFFSFPRGWIICLLAIWSLCTYVRLLVESQYPVVKCGSSNLAGTSPVWPLDKTQVGACEQFVEYPCSPTELDGNWMMLLALFILHNFKNNFHQMSTSLR